MKPFNIKEYNANPSRKVITRDGRPVRILCTNAKGKYPIVGLIENDYNNEIPLSYTINGYEGINNNFDLFFAPEKKIAWANLYCTELGIMFTGKFFKTEEAALKEKVKDLGKYITTFKVEWEE